MNKGMKERRKERRKRDTTHIFMMRITEKKKSEQGKQT